MIFSHKEVIFGIQKLPFFLLAKRIHSIPTSTKYLFHLRKEKKEPPPTDTEKKKKILNFKENKMTPPLCTFFRTHRCCLLFQRLTLMSVPLEQHLFHCIVGNGIMTHFLTAPLFISRTHPERHYCIFLFLYFFPSYFKFYYPKEVLLQCVHRTPM